jgi:2-keto-4-pentenoate hydratase/2-oxohepta-3-ene-1,7-dioic acid hydratase in catechol pathway
MRLVTVDRDGAPAAAVVRNDGLVSLDKLGYGTVLELIEAGPDEWTRVARDAATAEPSGPLDGAILLPPLPRPPRNMFCVGVNYQSHFDEGVRPEGTVVPEAPIFFTKPWTALNGHDAPVPLHGAATQQVDWEAEIAVVIGVGGVDIPLDEAAGHVFGYTLANDVSARDLQLAHGTFSQWFKGKSLDRFCPMGPVLITADELGGGEDEIHVQLRVNGVIKQDFSSKAMINSVPRIIARLSLGMALLPGDIILTGTAAGVGYWRKPKEFLGDGDVVEIESEQLGVLRSHFVRGV